MPRKIHLVFIYYGITWDYIPDRCMLHLYVHGRYMYNYIFA